MNNPLNKTPFLFLLIPLILGILLQYYGCNIWWSIIASLVGGLIILLSFWMKKAKQYSFRWLFAFGAFFCFLSIGGATTFLKQRTLEYTLKDDVQTYVGYVTQTPQEKPRSVAHKIYLPQENVNVVCYLQKDSAKLPLQVGDEIMFLAQLQAFKNAGNPNEFDYVKYMYNQGFVASAYLTNASWLKTGKTEKSLSIQALKVRHTIMSFYSLLGFSGDEHAILSALTLGYQDTLSDDLKQGFRATGVVHVLSVSGLHVGIIFGIISFLLSFISRTSRFYRIRPLLIILLLWCYAFVTGLPPSVIRASVMLSIFCLSDLSMRKSNSLNTLYIAAFAMLLYNPFWLFDIGFQLSFVSVLSILVLHKKMIDLLKTRNKVKRYIWSMFCISIVAQLATFPLCSYYFGTFPTYFFIANMLVVPLVLCIMYGVGLVVLAWGIAMILPAYSSVIYYLPVKIVQILVEGMTKCIAFFENLPFALIENVELSFVSFLLLAFIIIGLLFSGIKNNSKVLIASLVGIVIFFSMQLFENLRTEENEFVVYNRNGYSDYEIRQNGQMFLSDTLNINSKNIVLNMGHYKVLFINDVDERNLYSTEKYIVNYAVVMGDVDVTLSYLDQFYNISTLVIDSSVKPYVHRRLTKECENRDIEIYDVAENGAFRLIF